MASAFNLTAQLNLRGPSNIGKIVSDIRKQIGTIQGNVDLKINATSVRSVSQLNSALQTLNKNLADTRNNATAAANAINSFVNAGNAVNRSASTTSSSMSKASAATSQLSTAAKTSAKSLGVARSEMEEFGRQSALAVRRFAAFSAATGAIFGLTNALRQGLAAFVQFDKEFVKIQQVTGKSAEELGSLSKEITTLSVGLGVASSDLINVAQTLAQAGLSARETEKALKALALSDLAPSFENINDTVEGSIALMRQFGIGAGDLESALGAVNAVAARFAVEASDLIAAIQRTGGVFATASRGVSEGIDALNEFIAVFTSVRATTRESAETIATGLRTIFTRIQRADTIEALKEFGVVLTDSQGKFVGAYKAVQLLSEGLSKLDPRDISFSRIVEELGGFRQIGKVIPLIQQFSVAQEALRVAQKGQGSLAGDAIKAQLSLANQIAKVREEFLAFVRDIGSSDTFQTLVKGTLSLSSGLIKVASSLKGVLPILAILGIGKGLSAGTQFISGFAGGLKKVKPGEEGKPQSLASSLGSRAGTAISGGGTDYTKSLDALESTLKENTSAISSLASNLSILTQAINNINGLSTELTNNTSSLIANTTSIEALTSNIATLTSSLGKGGGPTLNSGGRVMGFARGGVVPGSGDRDTVPAMLMPGEFVIRKKAVETIGTSNLQRINKYAKGGAVKIASVIGNKKAKDGDTFYAEVEPASDKFNAEFRINEWDAYETSGPSKITKKKWEEIKQFNNGIIPSDIILRNNKVSKSTVSIPPETKVTQNLTAQDAANAATNSLQNKLKKLGNQGVFDSIIQGQSELYNRFLATSKKGLDIPEIYKTGRTFNVGGIIQKFMAGGVAEIASSKKKSVKDIVLEEVEALGRVAGIRGLLNIPKSDRTIDRLLRLDTIKTYAEGSTDLQRAVEIVDKALEAKGVASAAEEARISALPKVAVAGLVDENGKLDYSKNFEWDIGTKDKPNLIYAYVKSFQSKYKDAVNQMQQETSAASTKFAENVQYADIFGTAGEKLAFDFDKTLVENADILDKEGNPDIPKYSDRTLVAEALKKGRLTRLGVKLKSLVDADPEFIKGTRILTARPQSTVDLLSESLKGFGLPYAPEDITGVSGGPSTNIAKAKAANLAQAEKLIDDNLQNVMEAQKSGKRAFLYTEPSTSKELDELIGQGNIEGAVVEKALALLGANLPPISQLESNRAIDFPKGLGRAAQFFGLPNNIPTEIKRTLNGSSFEKARGEFARYFAENYGVGGSVELFHGSNTGSNNEVLESFKKKGALSSIATGYGQGAGLYLYTLKERAIQQAKMRVAGGIGAITSGDTSGKPMVLTFKEVLDPKTFDLDYELQKALVVKWLHENFDKIKDKLTPGKDLAGIVDIITENREQGIMSSGIVTKTQKEGLKEVYSGTPSNITEGAILGQIMNRLKSGDPELVEAFESKLFEKPLGLVLKYVGDTPLSPVNIETFAKGGSANQTVPALLTPGEAVIPPDTAKKIGYAKLEKMNYADKNGASKYAGGGGVQIVPGQGNSDTFGPVSLPVGSFVIRKKATEALGFNKGGSVGVVQKFVEGGETKNVLESMLEVDDELKKLKRERVRLTVKIDEKALNKQIEDAERELQLSYAKLGGGGSGASRRGRYKASPAQSGEELIQRYRETNPGQERGGLSEQEIERFKQMSPEEAKRFSLQETVAFGAAYDTTGGMIDAGRTGRKVGIENKSTSELEQMATEDFGKKKSSLVEIEKAQQKLKELESRKITPQVDPKQIEELDSKIAEAEKKLNELRSQAESIPAPSFTAESAPKDFFDRLMAIPDRPVGAGGGGPPPIVPPVVGGGVSGPPPIVPPVVGGGVSGPPPRVPPVGLGGVPPGGGGIPPRGTPPLPPSGGPPPVPADKASAAAAAAQATEDFRTSLRQAGEAVEVFQTKARQAGVSVNQFTSDLQKQVVQLAKKKEVQAGENVTNFRLTTFKNRGKLTTGTAEEQATAEKEIRTSLGATGVDEASIAAFIAQLKATSEPIDSVISAVDGLKDSLENSTTSQKAYDDAVREAAETMGIAESEVRKLASASDVAASKQMDAFGKSAENIANISAKVGLALGALSSSVSDAIKGLSGPDSRGGAIAAAGAEAGLKTSGAVVASLGQIPSTVMSFGKGLDEIIPKLSGTSASFAKGVSAQIPKLMTLLTNPYVLAGAAVVAAAVGIAAAFKEAWNAAREFDKALAAKNVENSMERVSRAFNDFEKDIKQVNILDNIQKDLSTAGANVAKGIKIDAEIPKAFWMNLLDVAGVAVTGKGGKEAAERSTILEKKGIMAYLQTTELFNNPAKLLGGAIGGAIGGPVGAAAGYTVGSAFGDNKAAKAMADEKRSQFMLEMAPEMAQQQAAQFKPVADQTLKLFESKLKTGTSMEDIMKDLKDSSGAPSQLAENIARANPAIQEQILRVKATNSLSEEQKQAIEKNIIAQEAEYQTRISLESQMRAMDFEKLQDENERFVTSLQRMYDNMDRAIAKTSFELDGMTRSLELSNAALSGQAKAGEVSLKSVNVLENRQAYSPQEQTAAVNQAAGMFGSEAGTMRSMLQIGPKMEQTVLSSINKTLKESPNASDEKLAAGVRSSLDRELDNLGLPPDLSTKMSNEVQKAFSDLRSKGDKNITFDELAEKVPALSKQIDSAKAAQEVSVRALEFWQKNVNDYAKSMNETVDLQMQANNHLRQAQEIEIRGRMELSKALGHEASLSEQRQNQLANIKSLTGGATSPQDIRRNITNLNETRAAQQGAADTAAQRGPSGRDEFIVMQQRLKDTNVSLRENYQALKSLAESGDMASAALSKINEIQQKTQAGTNIIEKLVTSSPEEINKFNKSLGALSNNMRGQQNASTAEERAGTLQTFNMIAPLLGDSAKQNEIKANVLESMLMESNVGIDATMSKVIDSLRNPEASPEMTAAIDFYNKSIDQQAAANISLAHLEQQMADNTADVAADKLAKSIEGVTLNFESQQLVDILTEVKGLREDRKNDKNNKEATALALGGIVYASNGQQIFQPKGTDTVPAMLTPGEFVVNRQATAKNLPLLQNINNGYKNGGKVRYYEDGGLVISSPSWQNPEDQKDKRDLSADRASRDKMNYISDARYPALSSSDDKYVKPKGVGWYTTIAKGIPVIELADAWYAEARNSGALGPYVPFGSDMPLSLGDSGGFNARRGLGYDSITLEKGFKFAKTSSPSADIAKDTGYKGINNELWKDLFKDNLESQNNKVKEYPIQRYDIEKVQSIYENIIKQIKDKLLLKPSKPINNTGPSFESKIKSFRQGKAFTISGLSTVSDEDTGIYAYDNVFKDISKTEQLPENIIGIRQYLGALETVGLADVDAQAVAGWSNFASQGSLGWARGGYIQEQARRRGVFPYGDIQSAQKGIDRDLLLTSGIYHQYEDALKTIKKDQSSKESEESKDIKDYMALLESLYNKNIFSAEFKENLPFAKSGVTFPITLFNLPKKEWMNQPSNPIGQAVQAMNEDSEFKEFANKKFAYDEDSFIKISGPKKEVAFPWVSSQEAGRIPIGGRAEAFKMGEQVAYIKTVETKPFTGTGIYKNRFNIPYRKMIGQLYNPVSRSFAPEQLEYIIVNNEKSGPPTPEDLLKNPLLDPNLPGSRLYFKDEAALAAAIQSPTPLFNLTEDKWDVPPSAESYKYKFSPMNAGVLPQKDDKLLENSSLKNLIDTSLLPFILTTNNGKDPIISEASFSADTFRKAKEEKLLQKDVEKALQGLEGKEKTLEDDETFTPEKRVTIARLAKHFLEENENDPLFGVKLTRSGSWQDITSQGRIATPAIETSQDLQELTAATKTRNTPEAAKLQAWSNLFGSLYKGEETNALYFRSMGLSLKDSAFTDPFPEGASTFEDLNAPVGDLSNQVQYFENYNPGGDINQILKNLITREVNTIRSKASTLTMGETQAANLKKSFKDLEFGNVENKETTGKAPEVKSYEQLAQLALTPISGGKNSVVYPDSTRRQKYLDIVRAYYEQAKDMKGNRVYSDEYIKALDPPTLQIPELPTINTEEIANTFKTDPLSALISVRDAFTNSAAFAKVFQEPGKINLRDYFKLMDTLINSSDDINTTTLKAYLLDPNPIIAKKILFEKLPENLDEDIDPSDAVVTYRNILDQIEAVKAAANIPGLVKGLTEQVQADYALLTGSKIDLPDAQFLIDKLNARTAILSQNPNAFKKDKTKTQEPERLATGGVVYASNGSLVNFTPRGTDTVPAMLTPGEFVINRESSSKFRPVLEAINSGTYSRGGIVNYLNNGGLVPNYYQTGGVASNRAPSFDFAGFMQNLTSKLISSIPNALKEGMQNYKGSQQKSSNGVSSIDTSVLDRLNEFTNKLKSVADTLAGLEAIPSQITVTGRHDINVIINGDSALNQLKPELQQLVMKEMKQGFKKLIDANRPIPSDQLIDPFTGS